MFDFPRDRKVLAPNGELVVLPETDKEDEIEVGDIVIYKAPFKDYVAEVFGIADEPNNWNERFAITYVGWDGTRRNRVMRGEALEKLVREGD